MGQILLSEYQSDNRSALIYMDQATRTFWVEAKQQGQVIQKPNFILRDPAEDWAEDWVQGVV